MPNKDHSPKEQKLLVNQKNIVLAIVLFAVVILFGGGLLIYNRYFRRDNDIPSITQLKEKASQKYQSLRGVSFEEENSVRDSIESLNAPYAEGSDLTTGQVNPSSRIIIEEGAKKIADKQVDTDVYFSESEYIVNSKDFKELESLGYLPSVNSIKSKLNLDNPFTVKSWAGACGSKFVFSQNNQTVTFSSSTLNYNINYLGGKYAVKSIYEDSEASFGCFNNGFVGNPDLDFVKALLTDSTNFKQVGTDVINGKKVVVYENDFSKTKEIPLARDLPAIYQENQAPTTPDIKIKYYVDVAELQVLRSEYFLNNKLIFTQNVKSNRNLGKDGKSEVESTQELSGVDIKEAKVNLAVSSPKSSKLVDAIKQFPIIYPNAVDATIRYINIFSDEPIDEYSKLTQTSDFDPNWEEYKKQQIETRPYEGSYSGDSYSMTIYKSDPVVESNNVKITNKEITVDGKKVTARLVKASIKKVDPGFEVGRDQTAPSIEIEPTGFTTLNFPYQNKYYSMTFFGAGSSKIDPETDAINLITLTQAKAQLVDERNDFINNAQPNVKAIYDLKQIDSNARYLPGDLQSKYQLNASYAYVDASLNKPATCLQLKESERVYSMGQCLIDSYNGFQISFSKNVIIDSPNLDKNSGESSTSFPGVAGGFGSNFYVFKAKYSEIQPYLKDLSSAYSNPAGSTGGYDYLEKNGYTYIFEDAGLPSEQRLKILNEVALDKDIDQLNKQLNLNSRPIPLDY